MMKKIVLMLGIVIGITNVNNAHAIIASGSGWSIDDNGQLTVADASGNYNININSDGSNAPWYRYKDKITSAVITGGTSIGHSAFKGLYRLETVSIPDTVTRIDGYAFQKAGLTSLEIPNSVTTIGERAFGGMGNLDRNGNRVPDDERGTLKTLILSDQLSSVGNRALEWNQNLDYVYIPDSIDMSRWPLQAFHPLRDTVRFVCQGDRNVCLQKFSKSISNKKGGSCVPEVYYHVCLDPEQVIQAKDNECAPTQYYSGSKCTKLPDNCTRDDGCISCTNGYLKKGNACINPTQGCGSGYAQVENECLAMLKLRYTIPEADAATSNDNENMIEWIFE